MLAKQYRYVLSTFNLEVHLSPCSLRSPREFSEKLRGQTLLTEVHDLTQQADTKLATLTTSMISPRTQLIAIRPLNITIDSFALLFHIGDVSGSTSAEDRLFVDFLSPSTKMLK